MVAFLKRSAGFLLSFIGSEKQIRRDFFQITGRRPINLALYKQAMRHSSVASMNRNGIKESYERLEYLGDAILGMVVGEYLYRKYPFQEEGFLTEIRSKVVNRESLNHLGRKIGLDELLEYNRSGKLHKSLYGDCMEALIGAVYLDSGFRAARSFIISKLIKPHFDLKELIRTITNYKSKLLEWSQRENQHLRFQIISEEDRRFTAQVYLNDQAMGLGQGFSKKKAEQEAAQKTYEVLKLKS